MKKQIFLTSTMAAALTALSGCSSGNDWNEDVIASDDTAICVDQNGNRIDGDTCDDDRLRVGGFYGSRYYLKRGSRIPYLGDSIRDTRYAFVGSNSPMAGVRYAKAPVATSITRSAAIARGGFGSSSRSFGGGRS
jgi:hypothetical protein